MLRVIKVNNLCYKRITMQLVVYVHGLISIFSYLCLCLALCKLHVISKLSDATTNTSDKIIIHSLNIY